MRVDQEIVIWATGPTLETLRRADLGAGVPVTFVGDEAGFAAQLPPHKNPLAFFIDIEAAKTMTPAVLGVLAARPLTFPPIVIFGPDRDTMGSLMFNPNSRIQATPETLLEQLRRALGYWVKVNVPLQ